MDISPHRPAMSKVLASLNFAMLFLNRTLPTLIENLALDEALLRAADEHQTLSSEVFRVWQPTQYAVIVGRSSRVATEVYQVAADALNVPIMRRPSGGATVVIGPGCLLYSLLIDMNARPALRMLDAMHHFVMHQLVEAFRWLEPGVSYQGTCDLVFNDRKFSGNSLKVGRNWTLYHGTILLDMQLDYLDRLLQHPPREPAYRRGRPHSDFVTNLPLDSCTLVQALRLRLQASDELSEIPFDIVNQLVEKRYSQALWHFQR